MNYVIIVSTFTCNFLWSGDIIAYDVCFLPFLLFNFLVISFISDLSRSSLLCSQEFLVFYKLLLHNSIIATSIGIRCFLHQSWQNKVSTCWCCSSLRMTDTNIFETRGILLIGWSSYSICGFCPVAALELAAAKSLSSWRSFSASYVVEIFSL